MCHVLSLNTAALPQYNHHPVYQTEQYDCEQYQPVFHEQLGKGMCCIIFISQGSEVNFRVEFQSDVWQQMEQSEPASGFCSSGWHDWLTPTSSRAEELIVISGNLRCEGSADDSTALTVLMVILIQVQTGQRSAFFFLKMGHLPGKLIHKEGHGCFGVRLRWAYGNVTEWTFGGGWYRCGTQKCCFLYTNVKTAWTKWYFYQKMQYFIM